VSRAEPVRTSLSNDRPRLFWILSFTENYLVILTTLQLIVLSSSDNPVSDSQIILLAISIEIWKVLRNILDSETLQNVVLKTFLFGYKRLSVKSKTKYGVRYLNHCKRLDVFCWRNASSNVFK